MTDILAEFFDQFTPEEQALVRAKEAEARGILLKGQDEARIWAAGSEFIGYQRVLAHRVDPVYTESLEEYLRQLDRVCGGILLKYGVECKGALAQWLAEAERLGWISLGRQLGNANAGTITAASRPEQAQSDVANRNALALPVTPPPNAAAKANDGRKGAIELAGGSALVVTAIGAPQRERVGDATRGTTAPDAGGRASSDRSVGEESDTESANLEGWTSRLKAELSSDQLAQLEDSMNKISEILEEEESTRTMYPGASVPARTLTIAELGFSEKDLWSMAPRELCAVLEQKATELRARAKASILRPGLTDVTPPKGIETASPQPATTLNSKALGRKRGPKPNYETAALVAEVVASVAPDGDWRPKLDEICEALDHAEIPCPSKWPSRYRAECWSTYPEKSTAVKAIEGRLNLAKRKPRPTSETLS